MSSKDRDRSFASLQCIYTLVSNNVMKKMKGIKAKQETGEKYDERLEFPSIQNFDLKQLNA